MDVSSLSPSTRFLINPYLFTSKIDDEIVMMDENQGVYFGLNNVAASIWELLNQPHSLNEIIHALLEQYDVSENICREEVEIFLQKMLDNKLICSVNS